MRRLLYPHTFAAALGLAGCSSSSAPPPSDTTPIPDAGAPIDAPRPRTAVPLFTPGFDEKLAAAVADDKYVYAGLAIDKTGECSGRWVRIAKDGSSSKVLGNTFACGFDNTEPPVLNANTIYWIDNTRDGSAGRLMSIPADGGTVTSLPIGGPAAALTFDGTEFFAESFDSILRINLATGQVSTVVGGLQYLGELTLLNSNTLFFTVTFCDKSTGECQYVSLQTVPTAGGSPTEFLRPKVADAGFFRAHNNGIYYFGSSGPGVSFKRIDFMTKTATVLDPANHLDSPSLLLFQDATTAISGVDYNPTRNIILPLGGRRLVDLSTIDTPSPVFAMDTKALYYQTSEAIVRNDFVQ